MAKVSNKDTKKEVKKEALVADDDFLSLIDENEKLAAQDSDGLNVSFISIEKDKCSALDDADEKNYIPDLKLKQLYVHKDKKVLGSTVKAIPLAFFSLFAEYENEAKSPKYFGPWQYEEGMQFDLVDGSFYDRQLPNGNILKPIIWVPVLLPDFPDMNKPILSAKVTTNAIFRAWKKEIVGMDAVPPQCLYTVKATKIKKDKNDWIDYDFTFDSFTYEKKDGKAVINSPFAGQALELAKTYKTMYAEGTLIPSRIKAMMSRVKTLEGKAGRLALTDDTDDEDDELPAF